ncbi:MAG: hypothetical protein WA019_02760, partial [Candidatus Moraniibacteriota bacterium]
MKIIKKVGWFLLDLLSWSYKVLVWIIKARTRLMKKMVNRIKSFFAYENLRKNRIKIIIGVVFISVISFLAWYIFKNYTI